VNGKNHCSAAVTVTPERQRRPAATELVCALFEPCFAGAIPFWGASEGAVAPKARL